MVANVGGRAVTFKFTDNDYRRDVLKIYNLDETVNYVDTTGFVINVNNGYPSVGSGIGWDVGENTGSQPTIRITLKDGNKDTIIQSGEWKVTNSSNGGNLK